MWKRVKAIKEYSFSQTERIMLEAKFMKEQAWGLTSLINMRKSCPKKMTKMAMIYPSWRMMKMTSRTEGSLGIHKVQNLSQAYTFMKTAKLKKNLLSCIFVPRE